MSHRMIVERYAASRIYRLRRGLQASVLQGLATLLACLVWITTPGEGAGRRVLKEVRFRSDANTTRVVLDLDGAAQHAIGRLQKPDRLYIDLMQTQLAADWQHPQLQINDARLHTVRLAQHRVGVVRVVLDLRQVNHHDVFTLSKPYRIVIDLQSDPNPERPAPVAAPLTIVIDPGHGGKDPGAIAPGGLQEKTVVLAVAKALGDLIRQELPHARVVFTRDKDVFVSLEERAAIANTHQADVFLSIHANASKRPQIRGIETWYLSFAAQSERAQLVAARENNMSAHQLSELERILRDLHETDRTNQSALLAGMTQTALIGYMTARKLQVPNRGVDGAPFMVLLRTDMPSILIEIGFLSNTGEAKRLRQRDYQQTLAQGIFRGLRKFLQTSGMSARRDP
jgi:N-acetylmuramoyl-L-alanine amidase